jgi:hypothetical protein
LTPAVTVVLPTYQRRDLVRRAVASVLAQTVDDFELIVVDDGSTDGTREALRGVDSRLVYVRQENAGVSAARNNALRLARGEIVAFLDSDNRWLPDHLETVTAALRRRPEAVLVTTTPSFVVAGRKPPAAARLVEPLPRLFAWNWVGFVTGVAARRRALETAGGFDESFPVGEDGDLWLRMALLGPFAMLRRRTVVIQATRGSLRERAREGGAYLAVLTTQAERFVTEVERAGRAELVGPARGAVHVARAIAALAEGNEDTARLELASACLLLPDLSTDPELVLGRLTTSVAGMGQAAVRARLLGSAARSWPDRESRTAVTLQLYALAASIRAGRGGAARELAGRLESRRALAVAFTQLPAVVDGIRRRVDRRVNAGRESSDLGAGGDVADDHGAGGHDR